MTERRDLRVDVADLLSQPGARRDIALDTEVVDLAAGLVRVPPGREVQLRLALEPLADGLVVHGTAEVVWSAECARCLEVFDGTTRVEVDELFEAEPIEGETYPIDGHEIDLEQLVRDALIVEFPLTPAPPFDDRDRCVHCGRTAEDVQLRDDPDDADHRWDALRALDL